MNPMSPLDFSIEGGGVHIYMNGKDLAWFGNTYIAFKLFTWSAR